jgi:hypothetical protein
MMLLDVKFEDFIGIFDTEFDTDKFIEFYNNCEETDAAFSRHGFVNKGGVRSPDSRKDTLLPLDYFNDQDYGDSYPKTFQLDRFINSKYLSTYNNIIGMCLNEYGKEYEQILNYDLQQVYLNVQKTMPKQGYHFWHCEDHGNGTTRRVLATMLYLNDNFEGGETEFLYLSKRIKPVKGRVLIWPAGFTHTHRGNPPLSGEKYIATSWIESKNL